MQTIALVPMLAVGAMVVGCGQRPAPPAAPDARSVAPPPASRPPLTTNELSRLTWPEVGSAIADLGGDPAQRSRLVEQLQSSSHPPAQYVRALLLLANGEPHSALVAFHAIEVDAIPGLHLYAPHRLQRTLQPGLPSAYRAPLEAALEAGDLPPLVAARFHVLEGRLATALSVYAGTDPADWTRHDLGGLRAIHRHAGLRPDVSILLRGALRGGRVPPGLRAESASILAPDPADPVETERMRAQLLASLRSDPEFRQVATEATLRQLEIRKLFATHAYAQLLDQTRDTDARTVTDETALLLLLSAARVAQFDALDRWSQELRRRFPAPEVRDWIQSLRPSAP